MQEELKKLTPEVIEEQKTLTLKDVATMQLHLAFKEQFWAGEKKKAKKKEDKERIAHNAEQDLTPYKQKIALKTDYYAWLVEKGS